MKITLFDQPSTRLDLLPFTFTRPISEIRVGILTIREKWQQLCKAEYSYHAEPYLQNQYPQAGESDYFVRSNILPNKELIAKINDLTKGESLVDENEEVMAVAADGKSDLNELLTQKRNTIKCDLALNRIDNVWDIFQKNGAEITNDYQLITNGRSSFKIKDPHTRVYNEQDIFLEEGVAIRASVLNADNGPIYIGKNCEINEGSIIQGPFGLGDNSIVSVGAKIRRNTSTGPWTKIGGEVSNSVIFGYSNKAHDGFLGNSVIGEWCNIGADTNTSNLKNNYGEVKIWNYKQERFIPTGSQFCGLMMGDHSKCAISTMFNTGTVVGVAANIFGAGFPRTSVPSFSWGGVSGYKTFELEKAIEASNAMMGRRNKELTIFDIDILKEVYSQTSKFRMWETSGK